jgi:hypothetical protein
MSEKDKIYLELHERILGRYLSNGLCTTRLRNVDAVQQVGIRAWIYLYESPLFIEYFLPPEDIIEAEEQGYPIRKYMEVFAWWADEVDEEGSIYNSTRQNIVLLLAAINGEL